MDGITEPVLRTLIRAGSINRVQVVGDGRSWYVVIRIGMEDHVVASQRHQRRTWKSLDTLVGWMKGLGIGRWEIDATGHTQQEAIA